MPASYDFSEVVGHLIRRSHQVSMALFAQELARFDVTAVQFAILQTLLDQPGSDQISVAQGVALDAATSGSVIIRLEERGWLRREASISDKRRKLLWLTPEGEKQVKAMKAPVKKVQQRLLEPLSALEQEQFLELLKKVARVEN